MKKLFLLTFLFTIFLCEAQQKIAVIEWDRTIGGSGDDYLYSVKPTSDGSYLFAGSSSSVISGNKTVSNFGSTDYWIVKLNSFGNIEWQKTIGGSGANILSSIDNTSDGGFILGGSSTSNISGLKSENSYGDHDYWIVKLDSNGNIQWQKTIGGSKSDYAKCITQTSDHGYMIAGTSYPDVGGNQNVYSYGGWDYWIIKLDSVGTIMWQKCYGGNNWDELTSIKEKSTGGFFVGGYSRSNISGIKTENNIGSWENYWVLSLNDTGDIIWQNTIGGDGSNGLQTLDETKDSCVIVCGSSTSNISEDKTEAIQCNGYGADFWILKLNQHGNIEWQNTIGGRESDAVSTVKSVNDGYLIGGYSGSNICSDKNEDSRGVYDYWIMKINKLGEIIWQKTIGGNSNDILYDIHEINEQEYLLAGYSYSSSSGEKTENNKGVGPDYWIVKLKIINNPDSIIGKVFQSQNANCTHEPNEKGLPNILVKTEPKNFFGISDTSGKYTILTDTGTYKVKPIYSRLLNPFNQQTVCPTIGYHTVSFSQYGKDTSEINFANYEKQCAYLQVELAQGRMRRCFDNTTAIKYCNIGNVDTTNVQVIVTLPEYVTFVSASNTNYTISGKKITFNIGNLRANECGTINLITKVDCVNGITGLTQCISAYILPRNKCVDQIQPNYALWDKSEVSVDGRCTGNTARFVIKNIGQNNMTDSSSYRIYKDAVQAVIRRFKLNAGDSLVINVTATGNTYRLEADQVAHFPSASLPSITIENCGTGVASRGFVNQQAQNTVAPDVEKICLPIRDSYDPNDKSVSPTGVGTNKLVKHKVPLDFMIRFQNTGTDTAYTVVIVDTLDQNLDLSTLEFGASSHTYKIEFTGSGKPILKFTFDKINLVDSFTNEPKSHGFVSFKITPYDSIPNGTLVKNSADIYFDFNLPIKTNTTQVSIDDRLPTGATLSFVTAVKEQKNNYEAIYVYPNPFNTTTNFEFVYNTKATQLIVYNINGELVANENVANQTRYQFQRNNLSNGMYFYVVQNKEGETIGRGKIVLQ